MSEDLPQQVDEAATDIAAELLTLMRKESEFFVSAIGLRRYTRTVDALGKQRRSMVLALGKAWRTTGEISFRRPNGLPPFVAFKWGGCMDP